MCGRHDPSSPRRPPAGPIDLDHVGIGVPAVQPELDKIVTRFGATVLYGGYTPGCLYVTTRMGDAAAGMDLELLEPADADQEPFLERFLQRSGPGAHHITFIARDLPATLARFAERGLEPVVRRDFEHWHEAFFAPFQTGGIVVQVAQIVGGLYSDDAFDAARAGEGLGAEMIARQGWDPGTEGWWRWPGERAHETAYLTRVVLATDDLEHGVGFYEGVLGGEVVERSPDAAELLWPRGGRLRLERDESRPPGFDRIEVERPPAGVGSIGGADVRAVARFDDGLAAAPVFRVDGDRVRLLGSRCEACGATAFPRRAVCLACEGSHAPVTLSGEGVVHAAATVDNPPQGFDDGFTYVAVDLVEGPRILGPLLAGARTAAGATVRAVPAPVRDDEAGFRFEAARDA